MKCVGKKQVYKGPLGRSVSLFAEEVPSLQTVGKLEAVQPLIQFLRPKSDIQVKIRYFAA